MKSICYQLIDWIEYYHGRPINQSLFVNRKQKFQQLQWRFVFSHKVALVSKPVNTTKIIVLYEDSTICKL